MAIGIALDSTYSHLAGFLPEADWRRIVDLLQALGSRCSRRNSPGICDHERSRGVRAARLEEFREHLGGQLTIMLLRGIGEPSTCTRSIAISSCGASRCCKAPAGGPPSSRGTVMTHPIAVEREGAR